jgi:uncharacterized protein DUF3667
LTGESSAARESLQCRNCGAYAPDRYCSHCGQDTKEHLPSAREFVHEFVLHYFAAEGRLWRTLKMLVLHPGRLTVEYLRGRKLAYVLPLRLYLSVSVVFFLLLQLAAAPGNMRVVSAFHRSLNNGHSTFTIVDLGFAKALRNPDGSFTCDLPQWFCNRIKERLLQQPGELERRVSLLPTALVAHLSTAVFVLLPLFAFYLQLAYFRRTYGEHFLFALHVHSFWFLALILLFLPMPALIREVLVGCLVVYTVVALHAVYDSAWWKTVLKALVIGAAYLASLMVAVSVTAIGTLIE